MPGRVACCLSVPAIRGRLSGCLSAVLPSVPLHEVPPVDAADSCQLSVVLRAAEYVADHLLRIARCTVPGPGHMAIGANED